MLQCLQLCLLCGKKRQTGKQDLIFFKREKNAYKNYFKKMYQKTSDQTSDTARSNYWPVIC